MKWFVLYTKPKAEQKATRELEKMGIEVYCPLITELRQWSDRTKKVKTPLFKSYIFVRLQEPDRNIVFSVPTVVRYLTWLGKPAVVKEEEIEVIKEWLEEDAYEAPQVHSFSPGDLVTINNGAMKGRSGVVQEIGKREIRLVLESLGFVITTRIKDVQ